MEIRLRSTSKVIELVGENGAALPARIWEGETASGIPVVAFITRLRVDATTDLRGFQRELLEMAEPSPQAAGIPLRLIL